MGSDTPHILWSASSGTARCSGTIYGRGGGRGPLYLVVLSAPGAQSSATRYPGTSCAQCHNLGHPLRKSGGKVQHPGAVCRICMYRAGELASRTARTTLETMQRITEAILGARVRGLNERTGNPLEPYKRNENTGRYEAQIGCFYVGGAYGGFRLEQIVGEGGGCRDISLRGTRRDVYNFIGAMLTGFQLCERIRDEEKPDDPQHSRNPLLHPLLPNPRGLHRSPPVLEND